MLLPAHYNRWDVAVRVASRLAKREGVKFRIKRVFSGRPPKFYWWEITQTNSALGKRGRA